MPYVIPDAVHEPLYAIVPYQNPWRWKSREKHTLRAVKHFMDSGAVVVLVECAFNRRDFAFQNEGLNGTPANCKFHDQPYCHKYIGVRSPQELWLKENLVNRAVQELPYNWQQMCWLDSDVHFVRPNWVGECIHQLQHFSFLQMFTEARDLAPDYQMMPEDYPHASGLGFIEAWRRGDILNDVERLEGKLRKIETQAAGAAPVVKADFAKLDSDLGILVADLEKYPYPGRVFPGLAWACTRKAYDDVGGLFDQAIWGGGDWHMSHALIEKTEGMMRSDLHRNYKKAVMQWYERCRTNIRMNVGAMTGTIFHYWHGKKRGRGYNSKHALLARLGFDPPRHLKRDSQGLWQLHDDRSSAFVGIRDMMRVIARERDEDSIDT
jgi:hypothetical protein